MRELVNHDVFHIWLHFEALCFLLLSIWLYTRTNSGWLLFLLCFLIPDLSMLAYVVSARVGGVVYNTVHNYGGPIAVGILGTALSAETASGIACIWAAHIF